MDQSKRAHGGAHGCGAWSGPTSKNRKPLDRSDLRWLPFLKMHGNGSNKDAIECTCGAPGDNENTMRLEWLGVSLDLNLAAYVN